MNNFGIGVEKRKEEHISLTTFFREYHTLCIVLKILCYLNFWRGITECYKIYKR